MIKEKWLKHLFAGITGLVALIVYAMTMAPTVSFWDCGEFIACANTLGIPHPPGTPFFVFFARAVIVLLPFVEEIAKRVNYISVVSSAATVYLTALFAWDFLSTVLKKDNLAEKIKGKVRLLILATAALVSGFLLTFSDTFWFNAVEAEVYGIAMFILMLISYLGLVWYNKREEEYSNKILVFICYIAFLGVGAHLYTMLTIPAVFVLLLIAQPKKIMERWPIWVTGLLLCSVIYMVSAFVEISLSCLIVLAILAIAKPFSTNVNKAVKLSLAFAFVALIGYSTHLYIPIRSELNPIIDENDPEINIRDEQGNLQLGNLFESENWKSFNDFVERKQYGSESMLTRAFYRRSQLAHQILSFPSMSFGGYQMAQYLPFKVGGVNYANGVYTFDASENEPIERLGFKFPTQMTFMGDAILPQLLIFLLFNGLIVLVCKFVWKRNRQLSVFLAVLYALCSLGLLFYINFADGTRMEKRDHDYWVSVMTRNIADLNQSGAKIQMVPDPNDLIAIRQEMERTKFRIEILRQRQASSATIADLEQKLNKLQKSSAWESWQNIEKAFAQFGQRAPFPEAVHMEVRERDYFYTPAFIFMSLIFGIGAGILVFSCAVGAASWAAFTTPVAAVLVILAFAVPSISNYEEHDRSGLWVPWDYAYNLLNSCRPNAILFTNGDNDTFPLWFAQEVAGVRKDVRVVNLSLGNTDWYIKQMLDNDPILKLSYTKESIDKDMVLDNSSPDNPNHRVSTWVNQANRLLPQLKSRIEQMENQELSPIDSAKLFQFKVHYQVWDAFKGWAERTRSSMMLTQYKLVIDLALQNMDKPIEISTTVGTSNFMGLEKYMIQEGLVYNFVKGDLNVKENSFDASYTSNLIDSVFKFRGLGDGSAYINSETERLLSSYTSLYLQISFDTREKIAKILQNGPLTVSKKAQVDSLALFAAKKLELGIYQFPREWRCYWALGYIYEIAGMKQMALEALERGLKNINPFDEGGKMRLIASVKQISAMPDEPFKIEEEPVNQDSAKADSLTSDSSKTATTPVVAKAE